jgi:CsoR family transcriptional regulator, copper-sensing transcriptional repressor
MDLDTFLVSLYVLADEWWQEKLLKDRAEHCVREAVDHGEKGDQKIEELTAAIERFLRV